MSVKVSVVIPTYNRKDLLRKCLEAFGNQTYKESEFEVIVVDDGSTDGTIEYLREYAREVKYHFKYVQRPHQGPAAARNAGIGSAKGEVIAFTDDDCIVERNWLREITSVYESGIAGVGGRILSAEVSKLIERYCQFNKIHERPPIKNGEIDYLITANASFLKESLDRVGGFNESYPNPGGEDINLSRKIRAMGYKLKYSDSAIVYHHHRESLASLIRTYYRYGVGEAIGLTYGLIDQSGARRNVLLHSMVIPALLIFPVSLFMVFVDMIRYYRMKLSGLTPFLYAGIDFFRRNAYRVGTIIGAYKYNRKNN